MVWDVSTPQFSEQKHLFRQQAQNNWYHIEDWLNDVSNFPTIPASLTGVARYVKKTADESVADSTTPQNDDHLFSAMVINSTYYFELLLRLKADGVAADPKFALSLPAGATANWGQVSEAPSSTDESGTEVVVLASAGVVYFTRIAGIVVVGGTAGNFQLQWAQDVSHAQAVYVLANSFLRITKVS